MNSLFIALTAAIWGVSLASVFSKSTETLQLVHVIHRHGNRNPDQDTLSLNSPYYNESYYKPYGYGQLTNKGNKAEYHIGTALRERYNDFLGDVWNMNILEARSTNMNRTKMSAQLVLAGLWPPSGNEIWQPFFKWQPIPYNYVPDEQDKVLVPSRSCKNFNKELNKVLQREKDYLGQYNKSLDLISQHFGENVTFPRAAYLYFGYLIQDQLGFTMEKWTKAVYPEPFKSISVAYYYMATGSTALKKIMAGQFLKKVLTDTENKINGTLIPSGRKMFLYSAHEINLATLLLSLNAYNIVDIPNYGSYILIEVHKTNGVNGIKLFFQNYDTDKPLQLHIPGCDYFCPYDDFVNLVKDILPTSDDDCKS